MKDVQFYYRIIYKEQILRSSLIGTLVRNFYIKFNRKRSKKKKLTLISGDTYQRMFYK